MPMPAVKGAGPGAPRRTSRRPRGSCSRSDHADPEGRGVARRRRSTRSRRKRSNASARAHKFIGDAAMKVFGAPRPTRTTPSARCAPAPRSRRAPPRWRSGPAARQHRPGGLRVPATVQVVENVAGDVVKTASACSRWRWTAASRSASRRIGRRAGALSHHEPEPITVKGKAELLRVWSWTPCGKLRWVAPTRTRRCSSDARRNGSLLKELLARTQREAPAAVRHDRRRPASGGDVGLVADLRDHGCSGKEAHDVVLAVRGLRRRNGDVRDAGRGGREATGANALTTGEKWR